MNEVKPSAGTAGSASPIGDALAGARSAAASDMVVHTRARELVAWLVPHAAKFPREHRGTLARHLCDLAMWTLDALVAARHLDGPARAAALRDADIHLDQLRQYLHLAWLWRWFNDGQFEHASRLTEELGRLVGGWRRRHRPAAKEWAAPG